MFETDTTVVSSAAEPSPLDRVAVAEFLNCHLNKVSEWCDLWGMRFNVSKTTEIGGGWIIFYFLIVKSIFSFVNLLSLYFFHLL